MSDVGVSVGVGGRLDRVWQSVADAEHRAEDARRAGERIAGVRESWESDLGVWVEVDSAGRLTGLKFSDRALRLPGPKLADAVLGAVFQARLLAGERAVGIAVEGLGVSGSVLERLRATYIPNPPPQPEPATAPVRPSPFIFG